jgi:hypothetical protein
LAEVVEAAGWVADRVLDQTEPAPDTSVAHPWLKAVPVTELVARTWYLADRLGIRETLQVGHLVQAGR